MNGIKFDTVEDKMQECKKPKKKQTNYDQISTTRRPFVNIIMEQTKNALNFQLSLYYQKT